MADELSTCPDCGGRESNCTFGIDDPTLLAELYASNRAQPGCPGQSDEPVWYTLAEVIERKDLSQGPWQELMALAQILHDLRIHDTNHLMRNLGAVYVADDDKPLRGEYHYIGGEEDPDRHYSEIGRGHAPKEAKEPKMSSRRQAITAQKERKNEGH